MKRVPIAITLLFALGLLTACGGPPSLVGNWSADDGTGTKVIMSNGMCSGMFYNGGEPLDIGGPMTCSFSTNKSGNGRYALVVTQSMNQTTQYVAFDGKNKAKVYDSAGNLLFTMTRQ